MKETTLCIQQTFHYFHEVKAFISYLINPLPTLLLLILVGFLFYRKGRKRVSKWLFVAAAVYLLLVTTPFVPEALLQRIERQYPVYDEGLPVEPEGLNDNLHSGAVGFSPLGDQGASVGTNNPTQNPYILVLGSGTNYDPEKPATQQLGETALVRLTEGIRIHRQHPGAKLVLSAGKRSQPITQAEVVAAAALTLGVLPADTLQLRSPMTTQEEAEAFVARFGVGEELILVTSARHLPRAMYLFQQAGLQPIPAPTDFKIGKDYGRSWINYLPGSNSLIKSELIIHEYVGMLWAWITN